VQNSHFTDGQLCFERMATLAGAVALLYALKVLEQKKAPGARYLAPNLFSVRYQLVLCMLAHFPGMIRMIIIMPRFPSQCSYGMHWEFFPPPSREGCGDCSKQSICF
jgi:hypothetical protein